MGGLIKKDDLKVVFHRKSCMANLHRYVSP